MRLAEAIIFDLDGTLADTKDDIATAVNLTLRDLDLPEQPRQAIYGFIGNGVRTLLARALPDPRPERFEHALTVFRRHYFLHLLDTTAFYPGIEGVLEALGLAGCRLAVVTNKPHEYTVKILDGLKVSSRFSFVQGSEPGRPLKPDPAILLQALSALEVAKDRTLVVGDGIPDIQAARAAGVRVCAVGYGLGKTEELQAASPDTFCQTVPELASFLAP